MSTSALRPLAKRKRIPDLDIEVVALSPRSLNTAKKRVYICPEVTCVHHQPSNAMGDLTGIRKHYIRKHVTDKKWACQRCSKRYALELDMEQHQKSCGTVYECDDCGKKFASKNSLKTHRATRCHALVDSSASQPLPPVAPPQLPSPATGYLPQMVPFHPEPHHLPAVTFPQWDLAPPATGYLPEMVPFQPEAHHLPVPQWDLAPPATSYLPQMVPFQAEPHHLPVPQWDLAPPATGYLPEMVPFQPEPHHFPVNYPFPQSSLAPPPVFPAAFQPLPEYPVPAPEPQSFTQLLESDDWFIQSGVFADQTSAATSEPSWGFF